MKNRVTTKNKPTTRDEALKMTALLYLKEALLKEQYEQCPAFIARAKRFGATQKEISQVLTEHTRGTKPFPKIEAGQQLGRGR